MAMKKNLASVATDLAALANTLPTQNVSTIAQTAPGIEKPRPLPPEEPISQFSLSLRESLRKQLAQLSLEADCTMRAFVLMALKEKGLNVTEDDLLDRRKR